MKTRYTIYILSLIISLLSLTHCNNKSHKVYKIGLAQCANDTYWRKEMNRHMMATSLQWQNIELIITDGQNSNIKQIRDIDSLVKTGIDLLMVSPNEADSLTPIISEVYETGIPVILIDRKTTNDKYTAFIGADNTVIGSKAAEYAYKFGKENAKVLELHGQISSSASIERSSGFNTKLKELDTKNQFDHIADLYCYWSKDSAMIQLKKYLDKGGELPDIIYSHNDDMAIGANEILKQNGYNVDNILIIGTDGVGGEDGGVKAVRDGLINITFIYPDGSEEALEIAEDILASKSVPKNMILSTAPIDINNAAGLYGQMSMTKIQDERIIRQNTVLKEMAGEMAIQKNITLILVVLLTIGGVMLGYIVKLSRDRQRANQDLNEKNAEINAQKEELEAQASHLADTNAALERSKEKTLGSIRYAHTIQTAALPTESDLNYYFNAFVVYQPKDIVSGDFYWYHHDVDEEKEIHIIGVIDCTGHGVPGAFMSLIGVNLLDQIVKQRKIYSPATILEELNTAVRTALRQEETENNDGMESVICKIEKQKSGKIELTYEGAKFPLYHFIKSENRIETYKSSRRQVGGKFRNIEAMLKFEDHSIEVNAGDRIFMSSDGIGDQNNIDRKRYTNNRLVEKLLESCDMTLSDQRDFIKNDVSSFMLGCEQRDDITVLGIEV